MRMSPRAIGSLRACALIALPLLVLIGSLAMGAYQMSPLDVCRVIAAGPNGAAPGIDSLAAALIWQVRIPRALSAAAVGAALAAAGAVYQSVFKNPLASPYTLGVSHGAGFGAGLAIIFGFSALGLQLMAVGFGIGASLLAFLVSSRGRSGSVTLVLSGMLIGSLFSSLVALLKFVADPTDKLPQIVYWLMGSLSGSGFERLAAIAPGCLACLGAIALFRWRINVLSMGDAEARSFGVDAMRDRAIVVGAASALTALAVSLAGIVGWVGIVVPHLARMLVGADFRRLLPASLSLGSSYLLVIDDFCRSVGAVEVPIGVVTGIIGVPLFLFFIFRKKVSWA